MAELIMEMKKRIPGIIFKEPEKKYVTAGDRACRVLMIEAWQERENRRQREALRRQLRIEADDRRIMARAMVDLGKEIAEGFWEKRAV